MAATHGRRVELAEAQLIEERSLNPIKLLFLFMASGIFGLTTVEYVKVPEVLRLAIVYFMPVLLFAALVISAILYKQAPLSIPTFPLGLGVFLIVGGVGFDMVATVLHTPTLSGEGNVVAVGLFNSGTLLGSCISMALFANPFSQP
ncbi:MAG: hypothetical protein JO316_10785 [Abitibacteriaceae bacterium]|nr:hypothetical protein [Abditibacteriaceae bacterium]MBV9865829.1 hypothetical protein [Abditibacteriaceae bacterium]